ncbi:MAG TPA: hypothetical protein ENO24_03360, partial [Chloroflexi bacterium]|nr:hypothetical protein [Chloroflexota bacterium]
MPREPVETGVDTADAERLLRWLDEERRRDKALLAELEKRVEEQERRFAHTEKTLEGLEGRLEQANAEVKGLARFDQAVQHVRDELVSMLRSVEERLGQESQERSGLLVEERQARMQAVASLEKRIEQALKLEQALQTQKVDLERLRQVGPTVNAQIEGALKEIKAQQQRLLVYGERIKRVEESLGTLSDAEQEVKYRFDGLGENLKRIQIDLER